MPRAIWSGAISFGLVTVPVKAYPATKDHDVHFHQVDSQGNRIKHEKVSSKSGRPVDKIKLGYETSKGKVVALDQSELDELRPASTKTIDVTDFVDISEIDPIFYERTYWLAPDGEAARRPYALLRAAMEDQGKVGIGTVVLRNRQHLTAIRPAEGGLALSTLRFADEVVDASAIDAIPNRAIKPKADELGLARQIVDALASDWDPGRYRDTYTEELRDLIDRRARGETIEVEEEPAEEAKVVDLMEALQATIAQNKSKPKSSRTRPAAKKKPASRRTKTATRSRPDSTSS